MDTIEAITPEQQEHFWNRVDKTDSCWVWQGKPAVRGYGQLGVNGQIFHAHRFAYLLTHGAIPQGGLVVQTCHNRLCVHPDHLLLTSRSSFQRSPASGVCKLTETQVRAIRERYAAGGITQEAIAKEHEVTEPTINKIITRRSWPHV